VWPLFVYKKGRFAGLLMVPTSLKHDCKELRSFALQKLLLYIAVKELASLAGKDSSTPSLPW